MGYEQLAQDLGDKPEIGAPIETVVLGEKSTLKCKATGKPTLCYTWLCNDVVAYEANDPEFTIESTNESHQGEYKCRVSNEIGFSVSEPVTLTPDLQWIAKTMTEKQIEEPAKYSSEDVSIMFDNLAGSMEKLLSNPDPSDTEHDTTDWATESDKAVSEIQSYLQLIRFDEDQILNIKHIPSVFKFLSHYWNYQRCHLLKKVVDQFSSEKARTELQIFLNQFKAYLSTTTLGCFAPATEAEAPQAEPVAQAEETVNPAHATLEGTPLKPVRYPPFMKTFKIMLQSAWATCTLRDAENLLDNLLPNTVSHEFVWFSRAYRAEENSVCLEYVISPSVVDVLHHELEVKVESMLLSSMGITSVHVDGLEVEKKSSKTRLHTYAYNQEVKPLETQGQLIVMEKMLAELKDHSTQASVVEALQQRLEKCENELSKAADQREMQDSYIDTLQKQLQKGEEELARVRKKLSSDVGTLQRKQKTAEELDKTKWKSLNRSLKEEVEQKVTEHVDQMWTSIRQNEDKLKPLPASIKAHGKEISDMKSEVPKLKEEVKNSSQSAERRLMEMSSEIHQKQLTEEKLRTSEMNALQKFVEKQLQEYKHSIQELEGQISSIERQIGVEDKLQEMKREIAELKMKREIEELKMKREIEELKLKLKDMLN